MEEVFEISDSTARPYLKHAGPTRKKQISSKLRQYLNRQAKIPDTRHTLLGLNDMASAQESVFEAGVRRRRSEISKKNGLAQSAWEDSHKVTRVPESRRRLRKMIG